MTFSTIKLVQIRNLKIQFNQPIYISQLSLVKQHSLQLW